VAIIEPNRRVIPDAELKGTVWEELRRLQRANSGAAQSVIVDVVPVGKVTLQPGASISEGVDGEFNAQAISLDIPEDVTANDYLNDQLRFAVRDGRGLAGEFTLGDLSGGSYLRVRNVRVEATNNSGQLRDVRAWLVVQ
jgi:hypothetical protein